MMIAVFWFVFAIAVAFLAERYHRSGIGWFCLAVAISPLLAGVILLAIGAAADPDQRVCPYCAEHVRKEALVCKHCGRELTAATEGAAPAAVQPTVPDTTPAAMAPAAPPDKDLGLVVAGVVVVGLVIAGIGIAKREKDPIVLPTTSTPVPQVSFTADELDRCMQARGLVTAAYGYPGGRIPGWGCENLSLAEAAGGWNGTTVIEAGGRRNVSLRLQPSPHGYLLCSLVADGKTVELASGC
jgi:hypothetical protein